MLKLIDSNPDCQGLVLKLIDSNPDCQGLVLKLIDSNRQCQKVHVVNAEGYLP